MNSLFDNTIKALKASIQMRQVRKNVIDANIANAETPGYRSRKMDFEGALQRALKSEKLGQMHTSHGDHFSIGQGALSRLRADIYDNPEINYSNDGNTVDLEKEMALMNENAIMYNTTIRLINKKLAALKYAATEGNR